MQACGIRSQPNVWRPCRAKFPPTLGGRIRGLEKLPLIATPIALHWPACPEESMCGTLRAPTRRSLS